MKTLAQTPENNAKIKALLIIEKTVGKIYWNGSCTQDSLQKCLTGLNLNAGNSGWYNPVAVRINGLKGYFLVNQDGSLFCESRIIKQDENSYLIEDLSMSGWNKFESLCEDFLS